MNKSTKSFQEFEVYKKAVFLTKDVFKLTDNEKLKNEYSIKDQLKRAVISITNNIAEGSEYNNNKQFIRFLKMSKGSVAEVRNMLFLLVELNFLNEEEIEEMNQLSIDISKSLSKFISYLKSKI